MADSTFKLTYFNFKGLGESIRYIFAYVDVPFEDNRISKDDWPALKESKSLHQLPVMEIDGKLLTQSTAIARYVGKRFGLAPTDAFQDAQLESLVDSIKDLQSKMRNAFLLKTPEAQKESEEAKDFFFSRFDKAAANGYFYGTKATWVDVYFSGFTDTLSDYKSDALKPYPNLAALVENVKSKPSLKKYLENRPAYDVHVHK